MEVTNTHTLNFLVCMPLRTKLLGTPWHRSEGNIETDLEDKLGEYELCQTASGPARQMFINRAVNIQVS
jgi:hypothetical protein